MGKFYWLKLQKDFFKKHKMVILRSMENGMTYEAIFIHLMAESIDHDALLRFSDTKPYTPRTLAPLVGTDSKTMADALEVFKDLELIEVFEDGTIFVPLASENIGSDTTWAEKKRQYRDKLRTEQGQLEDNERTTQGQSEDNLRTIRGQKEDMSDKSIEYRDKSIEYRDKINREKEKEREKKVDDESSTALLSESKKRFSPPSLEEVAAYCEERKNGIDPQAFIDFYSAKNWMIGKNKMKDYKACIRTWESRRRDDTKPSKKVDDIPIMENHYDFSPEALKKREESDIELLDSLLSD